MKQKAINFILCQRFNMLDIFNIAVLSEIIRYNQSWSAIFICMVVVIPLTLVSIYLHEKFYKA